MQATADNNIILFGNEADLEILQRLIETMDTQPPGARPTFKIFQLEYGQARDLAQSIERLWQESHRPVTGQIRPEDRITIIPEARSNSLMVAASESAMEEIAGIINQLDQQTLGETVEFVPVQLQHVKAEEAAAKLRQMLEDLKRIRGVTEDFANIQVDPRTNRLLISAPEADLEQIRELVNLIDVEPTAETFGVVKMAIFPLKKAVAREMVESLQDMFQAGSDAEAAMQEQIRRLQMVIKTRGGEESLPDVDLDKPIKILEEQGSNSIVVASTESNLEAIGEIVELLDTVPIGDEMMVKIFPLEHADAEVLEQNLDTLFEQANALPTQPGKEEVEGRMPDNLTGTALAYDVAFAVDVRTNTLVVAGRPEQLVLIQDVVKSVDIAESFSKFPPRLIQLEHADVAAMEEVVQQLADQRATLVENAGNIQEIREQITVIGDPRTNSLIVVAADDNFEEIRSLVKELDNADDEWLGQIHIIQLDTLAAADLDGKIEDLWERRAELRAEGGLPEDRPVIVTDARSNSLVIAANREDYEAIKKLVEQLEQQPLSPMHEIRNVILEHNDADRMADILTELFEERLEMSLGEDQEEQPSDRVAIVADGLTNSLLIASSKSNYEEIVRLISQLDTPPPVDGVIQTFFIKNTDVTRAADMLRDLFEQGIYRGTGPDEVPEEQQNVAIVSDIRSSALIVSASPENLAIARSLIEQIDRVDVELFQADARFFPIEHADVVNVADMLEQLFEGMSQTMEDEGDQLAIEIVPNIRSNVLIVAGTRYAMKRAAELIPQLDSPLEKASYEMKVYSLEYTGAGKAGTLLEELFEERIGDEAAGERTPVVIIPDEGSNSVVVSASQDDHQMIRKVLDSIDVTSTLSRQMEVIPLAEARAETVADTLTDLIEAQQGDLEGGFAVVPEERTNSLIVFASPDLMKHVGKVIDDIDNTRPKREMQMSVIRLRNAKAEELADLLNEFFEEAGATNEDDGRQLIINFKYYDRRRGEELLSKLVHQDITIKADTYTNSLVVMAPVDYLDMMETLIEMLDSIEPVTAEIMPFRLYNADATEMKELLEELFESDQTGTGEEGRTLTLAADGAAAGGDGGGAAVELAFSVDERTNTLIAAGSPSYLKIVERLVIELDAEAIEERITRVVELQHAKAEEVSETLNAYLEKEIGYLEEAEEGAAAQRILQRQVTVEDAGETSNMVLLSYSPRMESQLVSMINELDRPPPQVMIQVLMAEVTLNDTFEFGVEFAAQDLLFSETAYLNENGVPQSPGNNYDFIGGTDLGASGSGLGGISFTITGEDFNLLVRALETEGRLEVLSRPAIFVQDNQEASIIVGERVPTVQDVTISGAGVVTPSVEYEEVGVKLNVTPIINPDGYVNLEIQPEISAIGTSSVSIATGVTLPTFTERSAETSVMVKDGETIVIGGLITSRKNESENKVPIAGDVPIIGNLFRAQTRSTTKTELLIVLTPHVVRDPHRARTISVQMRDQTGMMDETRMSPLMQGLQVRPEDDQFGPGDLPSAFDEDESDLKEKDAPAQREPMGPMLEEYGPTTGLEFGPSRGAVTASAKSDE